MKAKTLIFGCSDVRLQNAVEEMIKRQDIKPYCQIFIPGSVKVLFDKNESIKDFFITQLVFLCKKFSVEQIIFIGHEGCNAYGIKNRAYEKTVQIKDINNAEQLIRNVIPTIKITRLWGILNPAKNTIVELQTI
ncbi:hypothetical protein M0R01_04370 [bacterium]|nr:hypothetical protein [bacterium]